ncbi:hypothetical protein CC78DRAFT_577385 [Lojkania enalia]|uniref:Uncharacterized protein n=1 Tax=Lojkania enalia TaxID=147567 RepID=A0A9P4KDF0_9PLEO|nr:hypothetical protein CC78DRAFT_577385 [Didymosphaeria enalia]
MSHMRKRCLKFDSCQARRHAQTVPHQLLPYVPISPKLSTNSSGSAMLPTMHGVGGPLRIHMRLASSQMKAQHPSLPANVPQYAYSSITSVLGKRAIWASQYSFDITFLAAVRRHQQLADPAAAERVRVCSRAGNCSPEDSLVLEFSTPLPAPTICLAPPPTHRYLIIPRPGLPWSQFHMAVEARGHGDPLGKGPSARRHLGPASSL